MIPETSRSSEHARAMRDAHPSARGFHGALGDLFPAAPEVPSPTWGARALSAVIQVAAVALGAVVLLLRVPGLPPWDTIYGEDYWEFFTQAIQQPWHLFITYNGYWQFLPR